MRIFVFVLGILLASTNLVNAGVFNITRFVIPGDFAIGVEPEVNFAENAGVGLNLKYTHGINDLSNLQGIVGTGGGTRGFRLGGAYTFDFFPDVEKQPGIGIAAQTLYINLDGRDGQLETRFIPYIHKTFVFGNKEVEPFVAIPLGASFNDSKTTAISTFSMGAIFKRSETVRFVAELGVAINNTQSYFSGGVVYYH